MIRPSAERHAIGLALIDPDLTGLFRSDRAEDPLARDGSLPDELFATPAVSRPSTTRPIRRSNGWTTSNTERSRTAEALSVSFARGAIVDKYRLEEPLGMGGFAVVWRATHLLLRTTVALKLLRADVVEARPATVDLLLEEARCAARIQHPNVVRILDVTHTKALSYIVMEYIEGSTLASVIERGPLPWSTVVSIGIGVAAGLQAGLRDGLVHRDIKPANLLLGQGSDVKIVDFGLARALSGREPSPSRLVGTRGYMAPEVAHGGEADFRADIFSLGVTLVEAASGARWRPIDASGRRPPLPPQLPADVSQLLRSMVSEDPSRRPASYDALLAALRRDPTVVRRGT